MKQMNSKVATKLVTTVAFLGLLASGCAHESMTNDDPAMDLPALTLNDPTPEQNVPNEQIDLGEGSNVEAAAADNTEHNGLDSMPLDQSLAANTTTPAVAATTDIQPLPDLGASNLSAPVKKSVRKHHRHVAKHGKRGGKNMKIARHGKKSRKNVAQNGNKNLKKTEVAQPQTVAALESTPAMPAAPTADQLGLDGLNEQMAAPSAADKAATESAMTLPADSQIGSKESTTIEPAALTQAPDISSNDSTSLWIYWAGGMVILLGSVILFVKRRRTSARY